MDSEGQVMVGRRERPRGPRIVAAVVLGMVAIIGVAYGLGRVTTPPSALAPVPSPTAAVDPTESIRETAAAFLDAWEVKDWKRLQSLTADQSLNAADVHEQTVARLRITDSEFDAHEPIVDGDAATVPFSATWELEDLEPYEYEGSLRLVPSEDADTGWAVRWWYPTVHPDMTPTTTLERTRVFPKRAPILGHDGTPLVITRQVVVVGIQPARMSERGDVISALRRYTDASVRKVRALLNRKKLDPGGFYPVADLSPARFDALRPQLFPVDGLVFRREQRRRPRAASAAALIGSLAPITAEQLEELGEPYGVGDRVGASGLEAVFEQQLAGEPALEAAITDDVGLVRSLGFAPGSQPQPVRTTLDLAAQRSAQRALRRAPAPAAIVAIDARRGAVRAAAFTPANGFNRALSGLYAPGSTFKVVTSYAALSSGKTPQSRVNCPGRIRVADRFISNDGGAAYGRVTLKRALAVSCNTTYARLGAKAGPDGLVQAAEVFGFNRNDEFTLPAARSQFPKPDSLAETTRAAIGQARVQASPLHMASVAATAASGAYRPPRLLAEKTSPPATPLGPRIQRQLGSMMRAVVTSGTGRAADLPGTPVAGKTGTAQFGGGVRTHAWFIGFRGDLAFAVVVEGAGHGGAVAAPVAKDFLTGLRDR